MRGWPTLRQWIDRDRAGQRLHGQIADAAREWQVTKDTGILYRGVRLAHAYEWRKQNETVLNETERAFMDASASRRRMRIGGTILTGILILLVIYAFGALGAESKRHRIEAERRLAEFGKLTAETESAKESSKALIAEAGKLKAQLELAQNELAHAAPTNGDATKLRNEAAALKTKLAQAVGENEKLQPSATTAELSPINKAQLAALEAATPYVKRGFQIREDYWGGELRINEKKAIRQQLFKGNEYWFWMSTSAPNGKVSVHIYDSEGKLAEAEYWEGKTGGARVIPKPTGAANSASYFIIATITASTEEPAAWAIVYGFR